MENLKIKFTVSFWVFMAVAVVLKQARFAIMYFVTVLLHELAHYFVAAKLFYRCYEVRVSVFGAVLYGDFCDIQPRDRILVALAGPFVNALLCFGCLALWWAMPSMYVFTECLFSTNASMLVANLLPCYPLDGGRVVTGLLEKRTTNAVKYVKLATWIVVFVLFGLFVLSLFVGYGLFGVGTFALCLASGVLTESGGECYVKISRCEDLWRKSGMELKTLVFACDCTLADVAKRVRGNYLYRLEVVDRDLHVVTKLSAAQLEQALVELPQTTRLDKIRLPDL